jgi:DNA-binding NarL/FixJ family response regulator
VFSTVLAEDHAVTRTGLRFLLHQRLACEIVAETGDGLRACSLLETYQPDLLILDLDLPGLNGLDVLRRIESRSLSPEVIVFTAYESDAFVQEARRLGAAGYVLKREPASELITAVQSAMRGDTHFSKEVSTTDDARDNARERGGQLELLTQREREVLQLTAEAYTCSEIAGRLEISTRTVEKHRQRAREKLCVRNAVELATYVYRRGLLPWQARPEERSDNR